MILFLSCSFVVATIVYSYVLLCMGPKSIRSPWTLAAAAMCNFSEQSMGYECYIFSSSFPDSWRLAIFLPSSLVPLLLSPHRLYLCHRLCHYCRYLCELIPGIIYREGPRDASLHVFPTICKSMAGIGIFALPSIQVNTNASSYPHYHLMHMLIL
jgi:hypothetical protein